MINEEFRNIRTLLNSMEEYSKYLRDFWTDPELAREPQQIMFA